MDPVDEQHQIEVPSRQPPSKRSLAICVGCDLVIILIVGLVLLVHSLYARPHWSGFFCDDNSIRYPYHQDTVPAWLLFPAGLLLTVALVVSLEYRYMERLDTGTGTGLAWLKQRPERHLLAARIYCRLVVFIFGLLASTAITQLCKYSLGRLRPNFLAICQPMITVMGSNMDIVSYCSQAPPAMRHAYITDYHCMGASTGRLVNARLSFISGHASYGAYCAVHAAVYLERMMRHETRARACLQLAGVMLALYTGLSRISDHMHHWSDVLTGLLEGVAVALLVSGYLSSSYMKLYSRYFPSGTPLHVITPSSAGVQQQQQQLDSLASSSSGTSSIGVSASQHKHNINRLMPGTRMGLAYADEFVV